MGGEWEWSTDWGMLPSGLWMGGEWAGGKQSPDLLFRLAWEKVWPETGHHRPTLRSLEPTPWGRQQACSLWKGVDAKLSQISIGSMAASTHVTSSSSSPGASVSPSIKWVHWTNIQGGQKKVYSLFLYYVFISILLICIIFFPYNYKPTFAHPCIT